MSEMYEAERKLREQGYSAVCGVDEAGRGPLAGPVYAAAVILPAGYELNGVNDSKKLTERRREALFAHLIREVPFGIGIADEREIDELNILNATYLAMRRAILNLPTPPDYILIDGNRAPAELPAPCETIIGGDGKVAAIAAASIIAKVSRDRFMLELAERFPQYGFEKHKGYGTKQHYEALKAYGISEVHRRTFLKNLSEK